MCLYMGGFSCVTSLVLWDIISMSLAIGSVASLRSRYMYDTLNQHRSWYDKIVLSDEAKDELIFWKGNICLF